MRKFAITTLVGVSLALPAVGYSQNIGDAISGIAQTLLSQEVDRNAWADARRTNTTASYRDYLRRFPSGLHRLDAERALNALAPSTVNPVNPLNPVIPLDPPRAETGGNDAARENQLGLSRNAKAKVQRELNSLGYNAGGADGLWGRNTRNAISQWQAANNLTPTGYVTSGQVSQIADQAADRGVVKPIEPNTRNAEQEERALSLNEAERREIQLRLSILGHDTRGSDGNFGAQTRSALTAWQRAQGDTPTGYITADQVRELRRQTRG